MGAARTALAIMCAALLSAGNASAQQRTTERCVPGGGGVLAGDRTQRLTPRPATTFDVIVDVPELCVERIRLTVRELDAHLALDARVANLVRLTAGADVAITRVELGLYGVRAEALLLVDLDNVAFVVDRTMQLLDSNPQIVAGLLTTTGDLVGTVGRVGARALGPGGAVTEAVGTVGRTLEGTVGPGGLLTQTVNAIGMTVQRTVSTTGSIVERTLDATGTIVNERALGSVLGLEVVNETARAAGGVVRQVRDQAGNLIEFTLDTAGNVSNARVLQRAGGGLR
jgi:hypothetical protein